MELFRSGAFEGRMEWIQTTVVHFYRMVAGYRMYSRERAVDRWRTEGWLRRPQPKQ